MAMIYGPRQMIKDGKPSGIWHFTVAYDEGGGCHAVGPCADGCPGHTTPEDAENHWEEGELAKATFDGVKEDVQKKCLVCAAWTSRFARTTGEFYREFPLCGLHLDAAGLRSVYFGPKKASQAN